MATSNTNPQTAQNSAEVYATIQDELQALNAALLSSHPQMPTLLRSIHNSIKNDPACVTLLQEDEIHILVQGLEKQTNTYLAASISKPKAGTSKALAKTKMEDLGF